VAVLSLCDDAYPERLRGIEEAPPLLYVKGEITALSMPAVAVVGTRQASEHGLRAARIIAKFLISQNFCVVSGLALGIDAAAHEGAVEDRGVSVAVLAHGLDTVAPTSNRPLAKQLLDFGGALVSEHPPRVPPRPAEFVRRNRIQSGLSLCSIVVESGAVGGAIHQARFTRTQGRPLLVVSPKENGAGFNSAGAHYLIETLEAISISGTKDLAVILSRIRAAKGATSRDTPSQSAPLDLGDGGCPL
jgi:DNA processing protein